MSTGSAAIPLLKAAPEPDQLTERLEGGPWRGLELALFGRHVGSDEAVAATIEVVRAPHRSWLRATESNEPRLESFAWLVEAPVSWPSGAFVRVDRLDDEARAGIERSAEIAQALGSPVLTVHLFAPMAPDEYAAGGAVDDEAVEHFLRAYADACTSRGITPCIENVPPILRMRTGGVFLSPIGGHWRDLLAWRERIPELRFTLDTSHAALFRNFAEAYGSLFGVRDPTELALDRYVEELGPHTSVAHISDAHGLLGEGLPYGSGELDLDPVVARLAGTVPYLVAEINEPDPARSPAMKSAYHAIERALAVPTPAAPRPARRLPPDTFDWQAVLARRDPVPSVLELQELFGGRRVLVTGGAGSIGRALCSFLLGFRPDRVTVLDTNEAALTADRRARDGAALALMRHVLCDVRDGGRVERELAAARPDLVFHLAAYKHVDWAESFPEEFVDTNLIGSWNVLRAADAAGVDTVVVASTDKAALAASFYGRTKRFMEQLVAYSARRAGASRSAVRFVNVLGSAGSASELFLRQTRGGVPLTVTDTGMLRYWITMSHAACLGAHAALLARQGVALSAPSDAVVLTVGELAQRIWREAGGDGEAQIDLLGIRPGETLSEVLTGPGEELAEPVYQGIAPIAGSLPTAAPAWVVERLPARGTREEERAVWLEALSRPGLLAPAPGGRDPSRSV